MTAGEAVSRQCRPEEFTADVVVHVVGTATATAGAVALLALAAGSGHRAVLAASTVYAVGLLLMLVCSAACNIAAETRHGEMLQRFDHAAIFVMIAGTYTPFTACRLPGAWAVGMTAAVWTGALAGALIKLRRPEVLEGLSIIAYLAVGWVVVVGAHPVMAALDAETLILLAAGGALYMIGILFHLWRSLPFQNAIWHAFVVAAASCHYLAVLHGVVLTG